MVTAATAATESLDEEGTLTVKIDNESDPECTVLTVEGRDQPHLLMTLSGALTTAGFLVSVKRCVHALLMWLPRNHGRLPCTLHYLLPCKLGKLENKLNKT